MHYQRYRSHRACREALNFDTDNAEKIVKNS